MHLLLATTRTIPSSRRAGRGAARPGRSGSPRAEDAATAPSVYLLTNARQTPTRMTLCVSSAACFKARSSGKFATTW